MEGDDYLMGKYFIKEKSPSHNKYYIKPVLENLHMSDLKGSANIMMARVMGLTYADYLRFCRDEFNAIIEGKNNLYPVAYFDFSEGLDVLLKLLNKRAQYLCRRRETPWEIIEEEDKLIKIFDNGEREEIKR